MSTLTVSWQRWVRALRDDLERDAASGAGVAPIALEAAGHLTAAVTAPDLASAAEAMRQAWQVLPAGTAARAEAWRIICRLHREGMPA